MTASRPHTNTIIYVKLLLMAIFWGGTFIAGKIVAQHVGPFSAAFLRFAIASVFLCLTAIKLEGHLPALRLHQLLPVFLLGMTGVFAYNVFFFKGLKLIEAGRAAIIIANNPICIALFSALLFRERLTPLRLSGILTSIAGAMVVITRGDWHAIGSGAVGWGELFILGCVASWVTFSLLGKRLLAELSPLASVLYAALCGTACLAVPAWQEGMLAAWSSYTLADWASLFYLGFRDGAWFCLVLSGHPAHRRHEGRGVHQLRPHQRYHFQLFDSPGTIDRLPASGHRHGALRRLPDQP